MTAISKTDDVKHILYFTKEKEAHEYISTQRAFSFNVNIINLEDTLLNNLSENRDIFLIIDVVCLDDYRILNKINLANILECSIVIKKPELEINKIDEKIIMHSQPSFILDNYIVEKDKELLNAQQQFIIKNHYLNTCKKSLDAENLKKLLYFKQELFDFELFEALSQELTLYFTSIYKIDENRHFYLEHFAKTLLMKFHCIHPENEILKIVIDDIENKFLKSTNDFAYFNKYFKNDFKVIGNILKQVISKSISNKNSSIVECCSHLLMTSSSDKLGNILNIIEQKSVMNKKLLNIVDKEDVDYNDCINNKKTKKIVEIIKEFGNPLQMLKDFNVMQSNMFRNYKNEIENNCTGRDIVNMFDFVLVNGIKAKNSTVTINIINKIDEVIKFTLNEYILVNSVYAIIENAIEATATEIMIYLNIDAEKNLIIIVENNGIPLSAVEHKYIFNKCFSRKKGHSGNGLNIVKDWLESNMGQIEYLQNEKCFKIQIFQTKRKDIHAE